MRPRKRVCEVQMAKVPPGTDATIAKQKVLREQVELIAGTGKHWRELN